MRDIKRLLSALNEGLYEKEEAMRLALLCAVAGESIFFLGPPGTAKSMISRRIHKAFKGETNYFEYLMNEFSTPDEIFGTIKLKGLDEGIYEKNTDGYLPQANVAFLDEIWKSGPAILNTLLTIINEKKFHNGNRVEIVPLQTLLAASNELPKEKAGLEALYDRFIVRTVVNPVVSEQSFFDLCENTGGEDVEIDEELLLSIDEIKSWQSEIAKVKLDDTIKGVIMDIRRELVLKNLEEGREAKERFYVSDRRWKKIIHLLKTSAFLCGRDAIDLMDCQLITYCIWNTAKQREEAGKIVGEIVPQLALDKLTSLDMVNSAIEKFEKYITSTFYEKGVDTASPKLYVMKDGHKAYKIVKPTSVNSYNQSITPFYISTEAVFDTVSKMGAYYDDKKELIGNSNFCLSEDTIKILSDEISFKDWFRDYRGYDEPYSMKIETEKRKSEQTYKSFSNTDEYEKARKNADEKHYQPIVDYIASALRAMEQYRSDVEESFGSNLFASPVFKDGLMQKFEEYRQKAEDAKVSVDKQRNRYADMDELKPSKKNKK